MKDVRTYKCPRCQTIFKEQVNPKIVRAKLPKCPSCGNEKVYNSKDVENGEPK